MIYENDCTLLSNKIWRTMHYEKKEKVLWSILHWAAKSQKVFPDLFVRAVDAIVRMYSFFARISHAKALFVLQ